MIHPRPNDFAILGDPQYWELRRAKGCAWLALMTFAQKIAQLVASGQIHPGDAEWERLQIEEGDPLREHLADAQHELSEYLRFWIKETR